MKRFGLLLLLNLLLATPLAHAIILNPGDDSAALIDVRNLKGIVPLEKGGTSAALTASPGGLVYSTNSALAILSGTGVANRIPLSGINAAPSWSTATYPSTITSGQLLIATANNQIAGVTLSGDCTLSSSGAIDCVASGSSLPGGSNGDVQINSSGTLSGITLGSDTVLGALSGGAPAALSLPGTCNDAADALTYQAGVGFNCHEIEVPSSTPTSTIVTVSSGTTHTTVATNTTVCWNSATAGEKNETIPAAAAGNSGQDITVKDCHGSADDDNIIVTPVSGTIDGGATAIISGAKNSLTLRSDGAGNWMLI